MQERRILSTAFISEDSLPSTAVTYTPGNQEITYAKTIYLPVFDQNVTANANLNYPSTGNLNFLYTTTNGTGKYCMKYNVSILPPANKLMYIESKNIRVTTSLPTNFTDWIFMTPLGGKDDNLSNLGQFSLFSCIYQYNGNNRIGGESSVLEGSGYIKITMQDKSNIGISLRAYPVPEGTTSSEQYGGNNMYGNESLFTGWDLWAHPVYIDTEN